MPYITFFNTTLLLLLLGTSGCKESRHISDTQIKKIMSTYDVPGLSMAIIENGTIVSNKSYGFKNAEKQDSIDEDTVFEAASLSKPVFAYGVLRMVENGQLNLDKPLSEYITFTDVKNDPRLGLITARMVLSHTTGFPNWRDKNKDLKIHFKPGDHFSYSGEGFMYLQKVVEKISGQALDVYMNKQVFEPLGMTHSSYVFQKEQAKAMACGHSFAGCLFKIQEAHAAKAAASLHTTTLDYAKFMQAIIKKMGLKEKTINEMLSPHVIVGKDRINSLENYSGKLSTTVFWGLGWGLQKTSKGQAFWHWGDNSGYKNYVVGFNDGSAIVIFTNGDNGMAAVSDIIYHIYKERHAAIDWLDYKLPKKRIAIQVNPEIYDQYVGKYRLRQDLEFTITREENKLMVQPTGRDKIEAFPETETDFFDKTVDVQFSFIKDKCDNITKLIFHRGGKDQVAEKIE